MQLLKPTLLVILVLAAAGCAPAGVVQESPTASEGLSPHENLNSVLWVQTAVEYEALTRQTYAAASRMLEAALADPSWTAAVEQQDMGGYERLSPAVVLDVDETVLDNSPFQARLILDGETYNTNLWNDWAREAAAAAVPGALEFTRTADSLGVVVIYLTNRRSVVEEPTRQNLEALGFPLSDETDVVLTRGEKEAWAASDKTPRREETARKYRILMLVGDNLGDFIALDDDPPAARKRAVARYDDYWGSRWIMLPNPQYGSWEESVIGYDYSAPSAEQLRRKIESLEPAR